jgi:hypothetical protein
MRARADRWNCQDAPSPSFNLANAMNLRIKSARSFSSSSAMKIAYVVDIFPALSETFVRDETNWMTRRGHLTRVFAFQIDETLFRTLDARIPGRLERLSIRWIDRLERPAIISKWLLRAPNRFLRAYQKACQDPAELSNTFWNAAEWALRLSSEQFDIIHVHFAGPAVQTARYASLLSGIPFTV